jgi:putative ABC transport system permease protein
MNKRSSKTPPAWADRFLEWYCNPHLLEDIQGDVHELYHRSARRSKRKADLIFIWNVIRFFRWKNIRRNSQRSTRQSIPFAMLKSYFITGVRNIMRNLVPSSINIVGLSVALGCAITIFLILDSYYNRDSFHEKGDRLYLLMSRMKSADEVENWAKGPYLLGSSLKDENSAVESVVRIQTEELSVRHGDVVFNEPVWFVDADFFNAFSYPLAYGAKTALFDNNNIVISEEIASKYFGHADVIGEELSVKYLTGEKSIYKIGAVLKRIPDKSSMFIHILIPMKNWEDKIEAHRREIQWKTWASSTFVVLKEGHRPEELNASLEKYKKLQNEANHKFQLQQVEFIPISKAAERSYDIKHSLSWSNIPAAMVALATVAVLLVLLACFNYMNVAVASVSTRLKEIGIRKVIGGGKKEIVQQFLIENIILCLLALLVGTALAYIIILPGFNSLYPIHVPFEFSSQGVMFGFFGVVLITVSVISGAYPAFYVSSFNPLKILSGKEKFGSKSLLSKVFLSFQFILSFTTIVGCLVFVNSSYYFESKDWGYAHEQHLFVPVHNVTQYHALKDRVAQNRHVLQYAGAESHIGYSQHTTVINYLDHQVNVIRFEVGFNYLQTMNVRLKEGRFFDEAIASDKTESVIVNQTFVRKMGWKDPLNQSFEFDHVKWYVVGVVEDFYFREFYNQIEPTMIHIGPEEKFEYLVVKTESGYASSVYDFIKQSWPSIAADDPFEGFFQDKVFEQFFNSNRSNNKIMYFLSAVAMILACMGLYGLLSYNLTRRLKEFSVRKIFGANLIHIFNLMNRDYLWILLFSFAVGAPLGFYMMGLMIHAAYPEDIPIKAWPFFITIGLMVFTVAITISTQLRRVAKENPTTTLRND